MNHDPDNPTVEHDVDIADLEDRLYAQIHHGIGDNEMPSPANAATERNDKKSDDKLRSVSAHSMIKSSSNASTEKNGGRYWNGDGNGRSSSPKPFQHNRKEKTNYNPFAAKNGTKHASNRNAAVTSTSSITEQHSISIVPSSNKPKAFTPYKPLLSDIGEISSSSNTNNNNISNTNSNNGQSNAVVENGESHDNAKVSSGLEKTSKLIKNHQKSGASAKRKNPFAASSVVKSEEKRLNPFSRLREETFKTKQKNEPKKKQKGGKATSVVIESVDSDDSGDDDEVIILPTEPPPLICIDSSDDEPPEVKRKKTEPQAGTSKQLLGKMPGNSRCTSPTNSILSSDDFIVQTDRRRIENDHFCGISGEELLEIDRTVDKVLQRSQRTFCSENSVLDADTSVFATPRQKKKEKKDKGPAKSYEMGENSFAAVDVYESESSDMPDTIYAKGLTGKRRKASSSSSELSDDVVEVPKSKRLKKRKSSGSARGSDFPSTDDSSDENADDDGVADSFPYLVRGEAVGKVKKSSSRKSKKDQKRKRTQSDRPSDEEFLSKLSSIVHGGEDSEASNDDELDESRETSTDSIAARDIVHSVLQKRSERSKKGETEANDGARDETNEQLPEEATASAEQNENEEETVEVVEVDEVQQTGKQLSVDKDWDAAGDEWVVKDQVGQSDDENDDGNEIEIVNENANDVSLALSTNSNQIEDRENVDDDGEFEPIPFDSVRSMALNADDGGMFVFGKDNDSAENLEMAWNEEMKCFYNRSWGGEAFKLGRIQSRMPRNFSDWIVSNVDRHPPRSPRNRQGLRCSNCHESGHRAHDCTQQQKRTVCFMCGEDGHYVARCPNKVCLKCGKRSKAYHFGCERCHRDATVECFVCRSKGHKAAECPDKWRRYHSTTEVTNDLITNDKQKSDRPKYCSVCAKRGHLAEDCSNPMAKRMNQPIPSLKVRSYRNAYNSTKDPSEAAYVLFTSNVEEFDFEFGKCVDPKSNTIYGRFAKATDLKRRKIIASAAAQRNRTNVTSTITKDEVEIISTDEHTLVNSVDRPMEEVTFEDENATSDQDEILVSTFTEPTVKIDLLDVSNPREDEVTEQESTAQPETQSSQTPESDDQITGNGAEQEIQFNVSGISEASLIMIEDEPSISAETSISANTTVNSNETEYQLEQLKTYESEIKKLHDLKEQIIEKSRQKATGKRDRSASTANQRNDAESHLDSDSNYSFSDFYTTAKEHQQEATKQVTPPSVALPDFIPLSTGDESNERFRETSSPLPVADGRSEAKIFLGPAQCKHLLTHNGRDFIKACETKFSITSKLEWTGIGNMLCITGTLRDQEKFRSELVEFMESYERKVQSRSTVQLPKNRVHLMKYIGTCLTELYSMSINSHSVYEFYHMMHKNEKSNTKSALKKAERFRRLLNMTLFGVFGFREGWTHLYALQDNLRELKNSADTNTTMAYRQTVHEHLNYIFTAHKHDNYNDLIELYSLKKRAKDLPVLELDRKLLNLPMNVRSNRGFIPNDFVPQNLVEVPMIQSPTNNDVPTQMNIQLNVSMPSMVDDTPKANANGAFDHLLPRKIDSSEIPSVESNQYEFWSEKSLELIEKLKSIATDCNITSGKLLEYERKARNREVHYTEYSRLYTTLQNGVQKLNAKQT